MGKRRRCDGGWDSLPRDLARLILEKISESVCDYIRFATVCKSWFEYAQLHEHNYSKLLLLSPSSLSGLISVPYDLKNLCGSSHGWLIFAENTTLIVTLFNPFTSAKIELPPLRSVENRHLTTEITKVALSDNPSSNPDEYEVLVVQFCGRHALFASRHGRWIYSKNYGGNWVSHRVDIIYFKGKFRVLKDRELGSVVKMHNSIVDDKDDEKPGIYIRLKPLKGVQEESLLSVGSYLVESICGTLLYVERAVGDSVPPFRVYEGISNKFISRRLRGLGDQALFLGYNQSSVCVRASDFVGCKPNSIYFTYYDFAKDDNYNVGVYTLGDEQVIKPLCSSLPQPSTSYLPPPPIWIQQPSLNLNLNF